MNRHTEEVLPNMEEIFPRSTEKEIELFENFDYAYIGARYDPKFQISNDDLEYLSERVKRLMELTEILCNEKIK